MTYLPFTLRETTVSPAVICPICDKGWYFTGWSSEDGAPIDDMYKLRCDRCNTRFIIEVETRTTYRVYAPMGGTIRDGVPKAVEEAEEA